MNFLKLHYRKCALSFVGQQSRAGVALAIPFTFHYIIAELGKLLVSFIPVPLHALESSCSIYDSVSYEATDFYYCIYLKYHPVKSRDGDNNWKQVPVVQAVTQFVLSIFAFITGALS